MTDNLDTFALEGMAAHLHAAGDARIYQLFEFDRWLRRQLSDTELGWSRYESDLSLAFESLRRDITSGTLEAREVVLRLVRLCVVRSTLASSANIPRGILLAAVRTAAWQSEHATSAIGRYVDRDRQASVYVSMLRADLDDAQRQTIQRALTALAFVSPDQMPADELLQGIALLEEPDQRAVADRLAVCPLSPNSPRALWQGRSIGRKVLNATDVVATMLVTPGARRPALVKKTVDTLIREATRISRDAMTESSGQHETPSSLDDVLRIDHLEITYGDYVGRPQVLSALEQVAVLLPVYPDPGDLPAAIAQCMGCAASPEEWAALSAAYVAALQAVGVRWQPPEYRQAALYGSPLWKRDQDRLWWMRQSLIRSGHGAEAHLGDGEDPIGFLSIEAVQHAWVQRALALLNQSGDPTVRGQAAPSDLLDPQPEEVTTTEPHGHLEDLLTRAIAPVMAAMAVSLSGVPPEMIDELIPEVFDNEYLMLQLFDLDSAAGSQQVDPAVARRAMGGLLCHALKEAYRAGGPVGAWADVDAELIATADLTPVVDFVLSLPPEPERRPHTDLFVSHEIDVRDVPLLVVLEAVADHLDEASAVRVADALLEARNTPVRNHGLDILASRLPREAIERILGLNWRPVDAREQAWALREIAADCSAEATDVRALIENMVLDAASGIEDGWAYVDAVLHTRSEERFSAAATVANPEVLATVQRMGTNDRTDALRGLSHHANRDETVPLAVFNEILALPTVNARCTYSWRAVALISCAQFLDAEMASRALDSAMELPERLGEGSSHAWGRDWETEFIRAAVVKALVPALSRADAHRAFEYAKTLPYLAREPVFRTLAETADRALAGHLFDHAVERYRPYLLLSDSKPPRVIEQVVSMEPPETFRLQRQVQTAELIVTIVDRLDSDRRVIAADLAMRFPDTGPCAWLGSAILNHLDEHDRVDAGLLTSMSLVDAYSYVTSDPSRIDVLIDLLPHVQHHAAQRRAELAEFITARFPDFRQPFLDEAHGQQLDPHDLAEYFRLTGLDHMPRPGEERPDSVPEADLRAQLAAWILSPVAQLYRDRFVKDVLLASPILSRVHALSRLAEVLPEEFCSAVLVESIQQLIKHAHQLGAKSLAALAQVIGQLPITDRGLFLRLVTELPAFDGASGGDAEKDAFEELYRDWGAILRPHPKYHRDARSIAAKEIGDNLQAEQFRKSYGFMTPRVLFLAELAQHLPQDDIKRALLLLRAFPEVERAGALAALLPAADDSNARLIVVEIHALEARLPRLWALLRSQKELLEMGSDFTALADAVVGSFDTATSVGAAALMLIGYLGRNRAFNVILEQAESVPDHDAKLKLMSLAVRIGDEAEHQARLGRLLAQLSSPKAQYQAMLMFSRAGIRLRDYLGENSEALLLAVYLRLSELSRLPRTDFLRELSGEMSLVDALIDDSDRLKLAQSISQVCSQWRWP